ncbi:MAG: protein phosphatase 2C domain-containing protein [Myxococcota bacterium]
MRSCLLRGRDHWELGAVGAVAEGPAAIALSRGGAPKRYRHTDPNEDAALFALGPGGMLIAVADGHNGAAAAEIALEGILADRAPAWTAAAPAAASPTAWEEAGIEAVLALNAAILAASEGPNGGPGPGATTLCVALVRPAQDLGLYLITGDSHLFHADEGGVRELGSDLGSRRRATFLGRRSDGPAELRNNTVVACAPLTGIRAIVLATDGLSEQGIGVGDPAAAVHQALAAATAAPPDRRALDGCKGVIAAALEAQRHNRAGDNAASAVLWLEGGSA